MIHLRSVAEPGPKLLDFIVGLVEKRLVGGPPPLAVDLRRTPGTELPAVGRARHALIEGVSNYAVWLRSSPRLLLADTTLRAIQTSQLAGAVRTADLCEIVSHLTRTIPQVGVLDVASQETMERCLREAKECPFRRIEEIRREAPGMVLRATLSAATSFGAGVSPRSVLAVTAKELVRTGVETDIDLALTVTPLGAVSRIEHVLSGFEDERSQYRFRLDDAKRRRASYQSRQGGEFGFEDELAEKRQQLAKIEADLADEVLKEGEKAGEVA